MLRCTVVVRRVFIVESLHFVRTKVIIVILMILYSACYADEQSILEQLKTVSKLALEKKKQRDKTLKSPRTYKGWLRDAGFWSPQADSSQSARRERRLQMIDLNVLISPQC